MILNKDLFDSPKDLQIAKLKYTIQRFKEYDAKRTEDYHRAYKELEWYKEEYENKVGVDDKTVKIEAQRKHIATLQSRIETLKKEISGLKTKLNTK